MNPETSINRTDEADQDDTEGSGGGSWGGVTDAGDDDTEGHEAVRACAPKAHRMVWLGPIVRSHRFDE